MKAIVRMLLIAGVLAGSLALCAPSSEAQVFRRGWRGGFGYGRAYYGPGWGYRQVYRPYGFGLGGYGLGYRNYGWGYPGYGLGYPRYGWGYGGYGLGYGNYGLGYGPGIVGMGYSGYGYGYPGVFGTAMGMGAPIGGFSIASYPY
jgi:hypothetical protein